MGSMQFPAGMGAIVTNRGESDVCLYGPRVVDLPPGFTAVSDGREVRVQPANRRIHWEQTGGRTSRMVVTEDVIVSPYAQATIDCSGAENVYGQEWAIPQAAQNAAVGGGFLPYQLPLTSRLFGNLW